MGKSKAKYMRVYSDDDFCARVHKVAKESGKSVSMYMRSVVLKDIDAHELLLADLTMEKQDEIEDNKDFGNQGLADEFESER